MYDIQDEKKSKSFCTRTKCFYEALLASLYFLHYSTVIEKSYFITSEVYISKVNIVCVSPCFIGVFYKLH